MSTLAAARADNFYFPPDHDPRKGSLNKQQGQHALRERAKKLDQGILVIRFEMPFNVWCAGCNHLIGKGVRFNAEKQEIGKYHSTKIWSFVMRAPCCQQRIEVQTDPKNAEYKVVSGGRVKVETYTAADAGVIELMDDHDRAQQDDPLSKLEKGTEMRAKRVDLNMRLSALQEDSHGRYKNDYRMNRVMRKRMRVSRKDEKARDSQRAALGLPEHVELLPQSAADAETASLVQFGDNRAHDRAWQKKRKDIQKASIFSQPAIGSKPTISKLPAGSKRKRPA